MRFGLRLAMSEIAEQRLTVSGAEGLHAHDDVLVDELGELAPVGHAVARG